MEELIGRGAVTVNGLPATIGVRVSLGAGERPGDTIAIDGRRIRSRVAETLPKVLLYHKPEGEIVSHDDPGGRASVFDALPRLRNGKWLSIGRLDYNTSGLLIFTDSGDFANTLMHPRFGLDREYAVRVLGEVSQVQAEQLTAGIMLADGLARFESIHDGGGDGANRWYRVVVTEGRNRLVRRLFEACRLTVSRLMRVRFGPIELPSRLKRGQYIALSDIEVQAIEARAQAGTGQVRITTAPEERSPRGRARDALPPLAVPAGRPVRKKRPSPAKGRGASRSAAPGSGPTSGRRSSKAAVNVRPEGASLPWSRAGAKPGRPPPAGPRGSARRPKTPGRSSRSR